MPELLLVPEVAAGATEVVIADWLVQPGTDFTAGDAIAVIETEKAVVDIEADISNQLPGFVLIGLPDTVWFPVDGLALLPRDELSFLLFPVSSPQFFDAVRTDETDRVLRIEVKSERPTTSWVWGAFRMPGAVFHELHRFC